MTPNVLTPDEAIAIVSSDTARAIESINKFSQTAFKTRGGRLGSGMGSLLEALWVYYINTTLLNEGGEARKCEIAWLEDNQPNDFACVHRDAEWKSGDPNKPDTRVGELFRLEAKSMLNRGVGEPKAHFTELSQMIGTHDQLLVLIWQWEKVDEWRVYPKIVDSLMCPQKPVALLRDVLYEAKGGRFVSGEPVNRKGVRERVSGPEDARGKKVSAATNFGSLVRMIRTEERKEEDGSRSRHAVETFRRLRKQDEVAHNFISFIHKNIDGEEFNQYTLGEWKKIALAGGMSTTSTTMIKGLNKGPLVDLIRSSIPNYQELLRSRL